MAKNRFLVILGAGMILTILLVTAFALGVYVGENNLGQSEFVSTGGALPNQGPMNQGQPGSAPPLGLPSAPPNLVGQIRVMDPEQLEIMVPGGKRLLRLTGETRFLDKNGLQINLDDLQIGDTIGVYGRLELQPRRQFLADLVVFLSP